MNKIKLIEDENIIGVFRGFSEGGLEFHADIVLPYRNEFQSIPMHGQFILVQLAHNEEAVLGRITSFSSEGRLTSSTGEDYTVRSIRSKREIPENLREEHLKYRVNIRVLGVIRSENSKVIFAPSHRRLPHVGSKVAWPSIDILKEIIGHNAEGADIGFFALGEYIYAGDDKRLKREPWMQILPPAMISKFKVENLVSRRSFIFARAGFGKSNLNKLLFSNLYKTTPTIEKRGKRKPVGTIIFDPDGEYFWPDDKGRPGLCDVPALEDKIVVFTKKAGPSGFYQSFVAGDIRLDIRRLEPGDVIGIALTPEQQNQQNVRKLRSLGHDKWARLVDEIDQNKNFTDLSIIKEILKLTDESDAEAVAARSNMSFIVDLLHSRRSQMLDMLLDALRDGKICVVDISQMRGRAGQILSGIILKKIFDHNQKEFTEKEPKSIPTIMVLEEAQSVLGKSDVSTENPYITWVKEGRKYDLGAVMVTQQPGSISNEILSQGDNWFIFHLLSFIDLQNVRKANAHFSRDLLSSLLNEPIQGHGIIWSGVSGTQYPISVRVLSFENMYSARDLKYTMQPVNTYASKLKEKFDKELEKAVKIVETELAERKTPEETEENLVIKETEEIDAIEVYKRQAILSLSKDKHFKDEMKRKGKTWRGVMVSIEQYLPDTIADKSSISYTLVEPALNEIFGKDGWRKERRLKSDQSGYTMWVFSK